MTQASQTLSLHGRQQMQKLLALTAQAYGVDAGTKYFAATPSVAQTLNDLIKEDGNWFHNLINVIPVKEIKGEKVMMSASGGITSRTDTTGPAERTPKSPLVLDGIGYELFATEADTELRYATIDVWAKFKDFVERLNKHIRKEISNDRIKIGWHGTSVAPTTDIVANPNMEDVNKGWLQILREFNSGSQVVAGTTLVPIELGGTQFPNLDTLVHDAVGRLAPQHREDPDLVCMVSRNLMQAEKGAYYEAQGRRPTEKEKLREKAVVDTYGGLPSYVPPFFPSGSVLVTSIDNLSIYFQEDSWRKQFVDNPKKNRYEQYNSRNEGYVLEQETKASLVEGVTLAP